MSQSAIWDALLVAGDMLAERRYDDCDLALDVVDAMDAWGFEHRTRGEWTDAWYAANCRCDYECECEPTSWLAEPNDVYEMKRRRAAKRPHSTLASLSAIYKQHYSADAINAMPHPLGSLFMKSINKNAGTITFDTESLPAAHSDSLAFETTPVARRKRVARSLWRSLSL